MSFRRPYDVSEPSLDVNLTSKRHSAFLYSDEYYASVSSSVEHLDGLIHSYSMVSLLAPIVHDHFNIQTGAQYLMYLTMVTIYIYINVIPAWTTVIASGDMEELDHQSNTGESCI